MPSASTCRWRACFLVNSLRSPVQSVQQCISKDTDGIRRKKNQGNKWTGQQNYGTANLFVLDIITILSLHKNIKPITKSYTRQRNLKKQGRLFLNIPLDFFFERRMTTSKRSLTIKAQEVLHHIYSGPAWRQFVSNTLKRGMFFKCLRKISLRH